MNSFPVLVLCTLVALSVAKYDASKCEVCTTFLGSLRASIDSKGGVDTPAKVEVELRAVCKDAKGKDERFCWYLGATDTSATGMVQTVTKPMSFHKPVEKICGELYKKDAQICDLKYEKKIDLQTVNIKKLKVKELRKVLEQNGEHCRGCTEKSEFVSKVEAIAARQKKEL